MVKGGNVQVRIQAGGGQSQNKRRRGRGKKKGKGKKPQVGSISGKGAYTIAGVASKVHKYLQRRVPKGSLANIGARLGRMAGQGLANITGVGDYVFNDIVHTPGMPTRHGSARQRISNCEYVTDLTAEGGSTFNLKTFNLNPYESNVFPWMNKIGTLYTKYRFVQLLFEFRSNTSDYAASGPLGTVIFAPIYNAGAGQTFLSKQQMEAATHAVSTKPSNSIMCGIECADSDDPLHWRWVRKAGDAVTNLTDHGIFAYATYGLPTTEGTKNSLGEIWVHYTVDLLDPILTAANLEYEGVAAGAVTWNSTGGRFATSLVGLQSGAQTANSPPAGFASTTQLTFGVAGRPTSDYFMSNDSSAPMNWWISRPGTYLITATWASTTAVVPNGLGPMYTVSFTGGSGTVTDPARVGVPQTAVATGGMCQWVVTTTAQDSRITFAIAPTYTNLATVVPSGNTSGLNSGYLMVVAI